MPTGLPRLWEDGNPVTNELDGAEKRLAELVLYVAERLRDDPTGGATKLNKVLYFAEFAHVRAHGRPITGVAYQKLPKGPAPRRLPPVREWLIQSGAAVITADQYFGYRMHRLIPMRRADLTLFDDTEVEMVDQVVEALRGMSAGRVSEMSHEDAGWRMADEGEDIPFEAAYLPRKVTVSDGVRNYAVGLAARLGIS